jgi:hypothetical protein
MIYNGSHSNMIRSVDDKYILDQMIDIGRLNHDWPPFKATLACISSLGRHVYKHGGALESLTLTNNFYHKDNYEYDEEDDEDDVIDRNSVPHPLIPVLLRRGAQLRELSIRSFSAAKLIQSKQLKTSAIWTMYASRGTAFLLQI